MIANKKEFYSGFGMLVGFFVVLGVMFMPIYGDGQNALNYLDNLYNSISKGSAYYIEGLKTDTQAFMGREVQVSFQASRPGQAENTAALFRKAGAEVAVAGDTLTVNGDIGRILAAGLEDSDAMFHNDGAALVDRYGYEERQALFNWWTALKGMEKDLNHQERFEEANFVGKIISRAVETAFNYYGIEPQGIGDKAFIVIFSLVFYVLYTLWFGFAIMYMFEGWGLDLEH